MAVPDLELPEVEEGTIEVEREKLILNEVYEKYKNAVLRKEDSKFRRSASKPKDYGRLVGRYLMENFLDEKSPLHLPPDDQKLAAFIGVIDGFLEKYREVYGRVPEDKKPIIAFARGIGEGIGEVLRDENVREIAPKILELFGGGKVSFEDLRASELNALASLIFRSYSPPSFLKYAMEERGFKVDENYLKKLVFSIHAAGVLMTFLDTFPESLRNNALFRDILELYDKKRILKERGERLTEIFEKISSYEKLYESLVRNLFDNMIKASPTYSETLSEIKNRLLRKEKINKEDLEASLKRFYLRDYVTTIAEVLQKVGERHEEDLKIAREVARRAFAGELNKLIGEVGLVLSKVAEAYFDVRKIVRGEIKKEEIVRNFERYEGIIGIKLDKNTIEKMKYFLGAVYFVSATNGNLDNFKAGISTVNSKLSSGEITEEFLDYIVPFVRNLKQDLEKKKNLEEIKNKIPQTIVNKIELEEIERYESLLKTAKEMGLLRNRENELELTEVYTKLYNLLFGQEQEEIVIQEPELVKMLLEKDREYIDRDFLLNVKIYIAPSKVAALKEFLSHVRKNLFDEALEPFRNEYMGESAVPRFLENNRLVVYSLYLLGGIPLNEVENLQKNSAYWKDVRQSYSDNEIVAALETVAESLKRRESAEKLIRELDTYAPLVRMLEVSRGGDEIYGI